MADDHRPCECFTLKNLTFFDSFPYKNVITCKKWVDMKRLMIFLVLITGLLASCKKHTINRIEDDIVEGEWMITVYSENDNVLTDKGYSEYSFDFSDDGTVMAKIHTLSICIPGKWSVYKSDGEVVFDLSMNSPLDHSLTEKWIVEDRRKDNLDLRIVGEKGIRKRVVFQLK